MKNDNISYKLLIYQENTYKLLLTTEIKGKYYDWLYNREVYSKIERIFQFFNSTIVFVINYNCV